MTERALVLDSYARESLGRSDASTDGQHAVNESRIQELGASLGKRLTDGVSAWHEDVERPDWDELLRRVSAGVSDGVVIFDVERFTRQMAQAVAIVKMAEKGFKVYDSESEFDLTTPSGIKAFYDAVNSAEHFSRRLRTKVKRGWRTKAQRGEGRAGRIRPWGFDVVKTEEVVNGKTRVKSTLEVNEDERPYVRAVWRMIMHEGQTWSQVCEWLNSEGQRTGSGKEWVPQSLRFAMRSPRMAGYTFYNDSETGMQEILGRMPGEPILDPMEWRELVALVESRKGRPVVENQLCSGLVLCGLCYQPLASRRNKHHKNWPDGLPVYEYHSKGTNCYKTIANTRALDMVVKALVIATLTDQKHSGNLRHQSEMQHSMRRPHEKEVVRLERVRAHYDTRLKDGKIDLDEFESHMEDIDSRIKAEHDAIDAIGDAPPDVHIHGDIRAEWDTYELGEKRRLLSLATTGRRIIVVPGSSVETAEQVRDRVRIEPVEGVTPLRARRVRKGG